MSEERLIKKYANRRLYDASQSRHITLEDIRNLVAAGVRVRVIEDKTNQDITRLILLQVIADQEHSARPLLSTALLEALIRSYDSTLQSLLSACLERSVQTFMEQQEHTQAQLARIASPSPASASFEPTPQGRTSMQQSVPVQRAPPVHEERATSNSNGQDTAGSKP